MATNYKPSTIKPKLYGSLYIDLKNLAPGVFVYHFDLIDVVRSIYSAGYVNLCTFIKLKKHDDITFDKDKELTQAREWIVWHIVGELLDEIVSVSAVKWFLELVLCI